MKKITWIIIKYFLIIGIVLLIISPIYFLILVSLFSDNQAITNNRDIYPDGFNIINFVEVIKNDQRFYYALLWTFLFAVFTCFLKNILLISGAYGLSLLSKKWSITITFILMFFFSIPEIVLYVGLYQKTIAWNLKQSIIFLPLSVPLLFSFFSLMYFKNSFVYISNRFHKMAEIDRLTIKEKILYIYLPKLKIPLVISIVFTFIHSWNSFLWPNIILSGTEILLLGQWFRTTGFIENGQLENLVAAGGLITMIIPLILYWIFSRWINKNYSNPQVVKS